MHAIIGPEWSVQAKFIIELGTKAQVPIISFAATSPSLSTKHNPYFVRTGYDDSSQVKAIAALVQAFGWWEISLIYEDTDYGNGLIPYLTDAFQQVYIRVTVEASLFFQWSFTSLKILLTSLYQMSVRCLIEV